MSHLRSPIHARKYWSPQDSLSQPYLQLHVMHMCPQPQTCCRFVSKKFDQANKDFVFASHLPPQNCIFILPQNLPKHPNLGYLSSILEILPQFIIVDFPQTSSSKYLAKNSLCLLWLCALSLIGGPRVTCAKHCVSWV
jgi:hypothetical protein